MASTLLLRPDMWDLVADANGNIAVASEPYAIEQDVASACRVWLGEMYYGTNQGVDYANILDGQQPNQVIQSAIEKVALTVPLVASATFVITSFVNRKLSGQVQFADVNGGKFTISI